jgi:hypothetical protein
MIRLPLDKTEVVMSLREHFENKGYSVSTVSGRYGISIDISAKRDKESLIIEAIGKSTRPSDQNIIFAIGKIVKRMKEQNGWADYGIAIPKSYVKFLKEFELGGIKLLNLHLFIVDSFYTLTHLDLQETTVFMQQLKSGHVIHPNLMDISF